MATEESRERHQEDTLEVDGDDLIEVGLCHVQEVRAAHDSCALTNTALHHSAVPEQLHDCKDLTTHDPKPENSKASPDQEGQGCNSCSVLLVQCNIAGLHYSFHRVGFIIAFHRVRSEKAQGA